MKSNPTLPYLQRRCTSFWSERASLLSKTFIFELFTMICYRKWSRKLTRLQEMEGKHTNQVICAQTLKIKTYPVGLKSVTTTAVGIMIWHRMWEEIGWYARESMQAGVFEERERERSADWWQLFRSTRDPGAHTLTHTHTQRGKRGHKSYMMIRKHTETKAVINYSLDYREISSAFLEPNWHDKTKCVRKRHPELKEPFKTVYSWHILTG